MGHEMPSEPDESADLLQKAAGGDQQAVDELLARHRDRLKRMVHLRLSRRLQGRVDDSDVLQETFLTIANRLKEYTADPKLPFYLWLRHMTGLKLAEIHRRHLGTQLRDADREVTLHRGGLPEADSMSLAAHLLGQLTTPSQAAIKADPANPAPVSEHQRCLALPGWPFRRVGEGNPGSNDLPHRWRRVSRLGHPRFG